MTSNFKAKKAGYAMHLQRDLEKKYDAEEAKGTPTRVGTWINKVLEGEIEPCTKLTWRNIAFWLRDGVVLCKLINKLRKSAGMSQIKVGGQNNLTAFIAMENISSFTKAATEYGLDESATFKGPDLYDCHKGPFLHVITCVNQLGVLANEKGFEPTYEASSG